MVQTCDCSHPRKEHLGAKFLSNSAVDNCSHDGCHCKKYHADKDSQRRDLDVLLSSFWLPVLVGVAFIGSGVTLAVISGMIISNYDVSYVVETKIVYLNGTDFPSPKGNAGQTLGETIGMLFVSGFLYAGVITALLYGQARYDIKRKLLINE